MTTRVIDPMTSPAQEVYDWLAERIGYRVFPGRTFLHPSGNFVDDHPITLDRLSGMLPEGWLWEVVAFSDNPGPAHVLATAKDRPGHRVQTEASNEKEARARVVAAVLMMEVA